jgi:transcription elongation factor Elf1
VSRQLSSRSAQRLFAGTPHLPPHEQAFTCIHCDLLVVCTPEVAGVLNRNHCPICLWSRHMDWREPGERRANCRAPMEPVGLTLKRSRNKYARERDGELMLIHRCTKCGKLVLNRIAADDCTDRIAALGAQPPAQHAALSAALAADGVTLLTAADRELVQRRLFGERS